MVRPFRPSDLPDVKRMMRALWPGFDGKMEEGETLFVWEDEGRSGGFISVSVRPWVDGAETSPCPHIEGWYVEPGLRRQGVGAALVAAAEAWCLGQGYRELTSDAEVQNTASLPAHEALGFEPTERLQYFRKKLVKKI